MTDIPVFDPWPDPDMTGAQVLQDTAAAGLLQNTSNPGGLSPIYEMMCCGLRAAEQLLDEHGIPLPAVREVLHRQPSLVCGCDHLAVSFSGEEPFFEPESLSPWDEKIARRVLKFEVHISRCVTIDLDGGCPDQGDCSTVLPCDDELPPERPDNPCGTPAPDTATETLWLSEEYWLLSTYLTSRWLQCMCEGWCQTGDCSSSLGCRKLRYVGGRPHDSGGCGGSILNFELLWP